MRMASERRFAHWTMGFANIAPTDKPLPLR
jgi:hypothetical protein